MLHVLTLTSPDSSEEGNSLLQIYHEEWTRNYN